MPASTPTTTHPDSIASICNSIVEQLVHDHIQSQLQSIHRSHKVAHQPCPQHPSQTHMFTREAGKDCFGKLVKAKNEANLILFPCTSCSRKIGAGVWTRHLAKCTGIAGRRTKGDGTSTLNSPMYKELSSDEEVRPPLFVPDMPTARHSDSASVVDDDDFTPGSTGSTSKKSVPKKRKKDLDKPAKPRKPRVKNPSDSPSKTHVNRFKQNLGEMVRTVSESPLSGGGGSSMARSRSEGSFLPPARKKPRGTDV